MFNCPECLRLVIGSDELISHVKYIHSYSYVNFKIISCPFQTCCAGLSSWSGFLRHIKSHDNSVVNLIYQCNSLQNISQSKSDYTVSVENIEGISKTFDADKAGQCPSALENMSVDLGIKLITELLSNFCSSLLATGVTNSTVDYVVRELRYSMNDIFNIILKLGKPFCPNEFEKFYSQTISLLKSFDEIKSGYRRQKLLLKEDQFVSPRELTLGSRVELRVNNNKRQQVLVEDTFMYVPLLKTLEKIVKLPEYSRYLNFHEHTSKTYACYSHSKSFKSNELFSKFPDSLQLQLFYDDFETVNPLGSKRGVHKIGALYFVLRNSPDFVNSQLRTTLISFILLRGCEKIRP